MILGFRPADLSDRETADAKMIVSNWSSSFKQSYSAGIITSDDWATVMHAQIWKHLRRPDVTAIVCFEKEDPDFLYGWIAGDAAANPRNVFYVYVKESFRRHGYENGIRVGDGIARQLLRAFGVDPTRPFEYSCQTPIVFEQLRSKMPRARWNPEFLRYPKQERRQQRWKR